MTVFHNIPPLYSKDSEILILGSFPSVKSRENEFFYGHKQNRFWKVIASLFKTAVPETVEEKKKLIIENRLALWDVIGSCEIIGSSDSSIKNAKPNDIGEIISQTKIKKIYLNGKTAEKYYIKYIKQSVSTAYACLPSTSPANAAYSFEDLISAWSEILK